MGINSAKKGSRASWNEPDLGKPIFPQALNGENGLVSRTRLDADRGLRINCPIWGLPFDGDTLQIEYSQDGVADWTLLDPIVFETAPTPPFAQVTLSVDLLRHGEFDLRFKVRSAFAADYENFSEKERVRIDLYGPYKSAGVTQAPAKIIFPTSLPQGQDITQDTLDLNPGGFDFEIPVNPDFEEGDRVAKVWFTSVQPPDDAPSFGSVPMESGGVEVNLPRSAFDSFEDGIYFAYYQLQDAAENFSEISRINTGRRLKRSASLALDPIVVVAPPGGALIDIEAWQAGVKLAIPQYAFESGDQGRLHWGTQTTGLFPLTGVFPFEFTVLSQLIADEYATQQGAVSTPLLYDIVRTGTVNKPDSPTLVDVDLSVEGPPAPIPGDPSPDLNGVTVVGPVSGMDNYLNAADIADPGDILATLDLWTVAPLPDENMIITLYWGSKLYPAGSITLGPTPGPSVVVIVDKEALKSAGNGENIPVFYGVSRAGSANNNYSGITEVHVDDAIIHTLDPAQVLNLFPWPSDPRGLINCESLRPTGVPVENKHLEIQIPPNSEFFADQVIVHVEFVASIGLNGDQPIEGTRGTDSITLDGNMAKNGFIFELKPFDPHLKGLWPGSLWFQYSVDTESARAKSIPAIVPMRSITSSAYCDGSSYP